jgi:hypothetical protein
LRRCENVPLYEYVLQVPGRPDERLLSDRNHLAEGDVLTIRQRPWLVKAIEREPDSRADARIILVRIDAQP